MSIKHSKFRNTGLLFELLVRQITSDTLEGKNSAAINILKKYFVNTELGKEYKLYEQVTAYKNLSEAKAEMVINTLVETSTKLKRSEIRKQKYNLVREIKETYNVEKFFKAKVTNYKVFAALNNLIENQSSEKVAPETVINNKITILEHLTKTLVVAPADELMEEYRGYGKDIRILTYKMLLEKFNDKYDHLTVKQKEVLREVITSVDNTDKLKEYYNTRIVEVRGLLKEKTVGIKDEVLKIKITEVLKYVRPLGKTEKVTNDAIINLLQYYELVNEL
tara:strand:+ start:970 stop:1803 length:834 start_codon:yes stop_codon:yes gene_type:complete